MLERGKETQKMEEYTREASNMKENWPTYIVFRLNEKMGYRYEKFNFGIQYETGYKAIEY